MSRLYLSCAMEAEAALAWMPVPRSQGWPCGPSTASELSKPDGQRGNTGTYCACPDGLRVMHRDRLSGQASEWEAVELRTGARGNTHMDVCIARSRDGSYLGVME
ncbi:MAG: hypothetical protein ACXWT1_10215 [Methylobacter sp.]